MTSAGGIPDEAFALSSAALWAVASALFTVEGRTLSPAVMNAVKSLGASLVFAMVLLFSPIGPLGRPEGSLFPAGGVSLVLVLSGLIGIALGLVVSIRAAPIDRKSVRSGKIVVVSVDLCGRRVMLAGRVNAGQAANPLDRGRHPAGGFGLLGVGEGEIKFGHDDAAGLEAGLEAAGFQRTTQKKAGGENQNE